MQARIVDLLAQVSIDDITGEKNVRHSIKIHSFVLIS
jgi:hypothetical protein